MNGNHTADGVSAVPQKRRRRKRGIVPLGGQAPLTPKELELHAQLVADGRLKSGRCGAFDYYVRNGKQCWRRHTVPKDPRTPAQQCCRTRFAASSKAFSEADMLTKAQRDEWSADAAKRNSRPRLGQSGPLTSQQDYIGRNCTSKQRDSELLLRPPQPDLEKVERHGVRPELTSQVLQYQLVTRSTSERYYGATVLLPCCYRGFGVYAAGSQRLYDDLRGQSVNITSAIFPVVCAVNVRPPPDHYQTAPRARGLLRSSPQGKQNAVWRKTKGRAKPSHATSMRPQGLLIAN